MTAVVSLNMSPTSTHEEAAATIAVTEMLNVRLPVDRGSGYSWGLAAPLGSGSPVGFAKSEMEAAGAPETIQLNGQWWYEVTFVGNKPGRQVIDMVYQNPDSAGSAPRKTYRIDVTVTKTQPN